MLRRQKRLELREVCRALWRTRTAHPLLTIGCVASFNADQRASVVATITRVGDRIALCRDVGRPQHKL